MSIEYLEDLAHDVSRGIDVYACPGQGQGQWMISRELDTLRKIAQRSANTRKINTNIYRLVSCTEAGAVDSYLICKKMMEPGVRGEPNLQWVVVDTRDAAELLRDVSQGPSPYFGVVIVELFKPEKVE
ncbi:MAG: hypothetical protein IT291_02350 [Deltaproteobacteria bacterium]|nr:hypothetical protein [Deltaproteobacteria bacterium]